MYRQPKVKLYISEVKTIGLKIHKIEEIAVERDTTHKQFIGYIKQRYPEFEQKKYVVFLPQQSGANITRHNFRQFIENAIEESKKPWAFKPPELNKPVVKKPEPKKAPQVGKVTVGEIVRGGRSKLKAKLIKPPPRPKVIEEGQSPQIPPYADVQIHRRVLDRDIDVCLSSSDDDGLQLMELNYEGKQQPKAELQLMGFMFDDGKQPLTKEHEALMRVQLHGDPTDSFIKLVKEDCPILLGLNVIRPAQDPQPTISELKEQISKGIIYQLTRC